MTQVVITDAGFGEAMSLASSGLSLSITNFKIGSGADYTPDKSATTLRGTVVYEAQVTEVIKVNDLRLDYYIRLTDTMGDYDFGEIGLYTESGTLFAIVVLPYLFRKQGSSGFDKGNVFEIRIPIQFNTEASTIEVIHSQIILGKFAEIDDVTQLPISSEAVYNLYLSNYEIYTQKTICYRTDNDELWNFHNYVQIFEELEVQSIATVTTEDLLGPKTFYQVAFAYIGKMKFPSQFGQMLFQVKTGNHKSKVRLINDIIAASNNLYILEYDREFMDLSIGDIIEIWEHNVVLPDLEYNSYTEVLLNSIDPLDARLILGLDNVSESNIGSENLQISTNSMLGNLAFEDDNILFDVLAIRPPVLISPANGANNQNSLPTLTASAFAPLYSVDTRLSREWQIDFSSGDFSNPVRIHSNNANSWTLTTPLFNNIAYKWRVRDISNLGDISLWSEPFSFTTADSIVARPTITLPVNGEINIDENPTLISTAFSQIGGNTHTATDWQVATDANFTNIVYQSLNNTASKTSINVPRGILQANQTRYYVRVRHIGSLFGPSAWSPTSYFNTRVSFYYAPSSQIIKSWNLQKGPAYSVAYDGVNTLYVGQTEDRANLHRYAKTLPNGTSTYSSNWTYLLNFYDGRQISYADFVGTDLIIGLSDGNIYRYNGVPSNSNPTTATPKQSINITTGNNLGILQKSGRRYFGLFGPRKYYYVSNFTDATWTGSNLVVAESLSNRIHVFNGFSNQLVTSFDAPGSGTITGLAWDGRNLISASRQSGRIYVHNGLTQNVLTSFAAPGPTVDDICMVDGNLVSIDYNTVRLYFHGTQPL